MNTAPVFPLRPVCLGLGVFFTSGVIGVISPVKGAAIYGIRSSPAEARLYPASAIRNTSLGITILALVMSEQPRALGTVLLGFSVMALGDLAIVLGTPNVPAASLAMHIAKIVVMPCVGGRLVGLL
ncbi:hypothetical protein CC85DRAFT_287729 [Cutaneotrichosporon oleaginosum]|uniref:DUF4267 domain-containing protein n=1 Tax=Cutaneotrichosporon oleaginosum TaxID=879819 RepID=A0A0J0XGL5_9TREE|nr:uncharacterized protein CC85DRAFT_287729 [Cutaneotrichosporon oleaginosum]KLT40208.1 hypothetical protein CC85DRAFT_287729 [Cutaneotrichosporon oleaginosum]TXT10502.1 hypothetical protein COLE_04436 [Cutaneotrichosporon oleaginosum]